MGPLVLPNSEIPQTLSEYLLSTRRGHGSFGALLRRPGHKNYLPLRPSFYAEIKGCRPSTSFFRGCPAEKKTKGRQDPGYDYYVSPGQEKRLEWGRDERNIMETGVFCHKGHLNRKTDRLSLYLMSQGELKDFLFLKSNFKYLLFMQSQGAGLVGGWWKGFFQNLGRRKSPTLLVARTRESHGEKD